MMIGRAAREPGAGRMRGTWSACRRAVGRRALPRFPQKKFFCHDARAGEPARAVRGRQKIRQPDGVRLWWFVTTRA